MTTTPDPRHEHTGTPSEPPTRPSSPGPDPDDVNQPDEAAHPTHGTGAATGAGTGTGTGTTQPTSPGPDPDDINR
ncbi:hypothetical protein [Cellulomonas pakistanensis]|uniref:Uncharacterized protein n=1 Tax=Cellulomonas pakistanensis TaxID=992287 RepID=A0A919PB95_9CELL|nr:hypothetical protein [Cellulomonas pakistanensis]GIG36483.1 hypothetical protein Cpa01nite_18640 [Cellulomonas pakistanensis]